MWHGWQGQEFTNKIICEVKIIAAIIIIIIIELDFQKQFKQNISFKCDSNIMFSLSYSETVANPVFHKLIEFNILIETLLKEGFDIYSIWLFRKWQLNIFINIRFHTLLNSWS